MEPGLTERVPKRPNVAMTRVKIAELKNRLSFYLRAVEQGAEIEITDRDRPIARLVPASRPTGSIRIIPPTKSFSQLRKIRYPRTSVPIDSTALLLEERGKR